MSSIRVFNNNGIKYEFITDANGVQFWYKDGSLHNEEGPAVIYPDGTKEYWLNGIEVKEKTLKEK